MSDKAGERRGRGFLVLVVIVAIVMMGLFFGLRFYPTFSYVTDRSVISNQLAPFLYPNDDFDLSAYRIAVAEALYYQIEALWLLRVTSLGVGVLGLLFAALRWVQRPKH